MTLIFLDANIPMYAGGQPHPLREPCLRLLRIVADQPVRFLTDAEVLQEMLHRYAGSDRWPAGRENLRSFAHLMEGRTEPVFADDIETALQLADRRLGLSARDLLHAAVMQRLGIRRIISTDRGFDRLPEVERLDPAHIDRWLPLLEEE
jgi:predicted nucleic acid-binding protein